MLIRIVRMTFREEEVENFLGIFNESKEKIRAFPGCTHLELWKGYDESNVFTTYSYWEDLQDLENYRNSELFKGVWSRTKALFKEDPVAFSVKKFIEV